MAKKKSRKSASLKEQAVLRLLKGEDMELVSRQTGFALHELAQWRIIWGQRQLSVLGIGNFVRNPAGLAKIMAFFNINVCIKIA